MCELFNQFRQMSDFLDVRKILAGKGMSITEELVARYLTWIKRKKKSLHHLGICSSYTFKYLAFLKEHDKNTIFLEVPFPIWLLTPFYILQYLNSTLNQWQTLSQTFIPAYIFFVLITFLFSFSFFFFPSLNFSCIFLPFLFPIRFFLFLY